MTFRVITLPRSEGDFDGIYTYIAQRSPAGAAAWANAIYRALKALETDATLHGLAPEDENHDVEVRQIFFRTRQGNNYRAPYTIRGTDVFVPHVRGPGQDVMEPDDVSLP